MDVRTALFSVRCCVFFGLAIGGDLGQLARVIAMQCLRMCSTCRRRQWTASRFGVGVPLTAASSIGCFLPAEAVLLA